MLDDTRALVSVNDVNLLPDEDLPDHWQRIVEGKESDVALHNWDLG